MKNRVLSVGVWLFLFLSVAGCAMAWEKPDSVPELYERNTIHSHFDSSRTLSEEMVSLILSAGHTMPTGGDQRSLRFYPVTDRMVMQAMRGGNPYSSALETAPLVIVIAADNEAAYYPELQQMDAGLAAGGMLIQATHMGLATCVLSVAPLEQRIRSVRIALSLAESMDPILMIAFGYPAADAISSASAAGN